MVELKYKRVNRLKFSFLRFKTLKIGNFCNLNEKWLIPGAIKFILSFIRGVVDAVGVTVKDL